MRRAAAQVAGAAILVAVVGYVAQFLAARWLGAVDYAAFAVFWALLFVVVGCLSGVAQEVIRMSRVAKLRMDEGLNPYTSDGRNPRVGLLAVSIGGSVTLVVLASGLAWGPSTFGADWPVSILLLSIAGLLVGGSLALGGMVAGLARWGTYSLLVALEAVARLVFLVGAALISPTVLGFSIAAVFAFLPNLLVALLSRRLRHESFSIRSDAPLREAVMRMLQAMAASGLAGILVIGWPALLATAANANPRGSTGASLGVLILLVTLTRAPIMVPLTSFQNALVARFTGLDLPGRRRWVVAGAGLIAAGSGVLAVLAALVGPPLLPVVFGAEFQTEPFLVAGLTAATAALGIITLTGVAAVTSARHGLYLLGWGVAIVVALVVLFLAPVPFEWGAVLALAVGPLAGAALQSLALLPVRT